MYSCIEALLLKACKGEDFDENLKTVCSFYRDDLTVIFFYVLNFKHSGHISYKSMTRVKLQEELLRYLIRNTIFHLFQVVREISCLKFITLCSLFSLCQPPMLHLGGHLVH